MLSTRPEPSLLVFTVLFDAMESPKFWQAQEGSLKLIGLLAETAPDQLRAALPEVVPRVSNYVADGKKQVMEAAYAGAYLSCSRGATCIMMGKSAGTTSSSFLQVSHKHVNCGRLQVRMRWGQCASSDLDCCDGRRIGTDDRIPSAWMLSGRHGCVQPWTRVSASWATATLPTSSPTWSAAWRGRARCRRPYISCPEPRSYRWAASQSTELTDSDIQVYLLVSVALCVGLLSGWQLLDSCSLGLEI